ncbi:sigma-54 interaction domain-containing protein [Peptostreptococcus sp.]
MEKSLLISITMNMDLPSLVSYEDGTILCQNKQIGSVCDFLGLRNLDNTRQLDIEELLEKTSGPMSFRIRNTSLIGKKYEVNIDGKDVCYWYIFNNDLTIDAGIKNVIEHIDEIIVVFNEMGILQKMNSICDQILPFKRKDVLKKSIDELVKDGKVSNPVITEMIEKKKKVYREIVYPNGKVISYTAIPHYDVNGNFKGGVLTGRDVSRLINLAKISSENNENVVEYISASEEMKQVKAIVERVAPSDASIFIMGESGVGKEIIARSLWSKSKRCNGPFVSINCASIPEELIESELFGYEKGAFTGANKEGKMGLMEAADGGTLFLDEIGEMPLKTQKKFLRAIQENAIMRIGSTKSKHIDVRYVCATNKTLDELRDERIFRQDLYYRLNVIPVVVPPLRDRRDDILPITDYYINYFNERYNRNVSLSTEARARMVENDWKGNIRELKNVVERLVILSPQENIYLEQVERILTLESNEDIIESKKLEDKPSTIRGDRGDTGLVIKDIMNIDDAHRLVEQEILKNAVKKYGNITKAAKAVGINPSTVYRKIKSGYIKL